jgi:hypothetical protein
MTKNRSLLTLVLASSCIAASSLFSCGQNNNTLTDAQSQEVRDSVLKLADMTAKGISTKGPIAWLDYFEDSPGFFMASDGSLALPDYKTAASFIKTRVVKAMPKITLKWSAIRVDPLTSQIAVMAAGFHEDVTDPTGKLTPYDGYFTALVNKTAKGWKFRDEHWSSAPAK